MLIFLNSVEEFQTLQVLLSIYNSASNSKVNYHRLVAFPLSGSSNICQREIFIEVVLQRIQNSTRVHLQRKLFVYARSHIAKSLILSSLWHILRVTTLP
ncbi:hypothetical protein A0J61_11881, partial [Choanephora cucurbitarum]